MYQSTRDGKLYERQQCSSPSSPGQSPILVQTILLYIHECTLHSDILVTLSQRINYKFFGRFYILSRFDGCLL